MAGSRSYIAHCKALVISCCFTLFTVPYYQICIDLFKMQRKARKDQKVPEPNAVEIFKDCHTSKKKGMTRRSGASPRGFVLFERCRGTVLVEGLKASLLRPRGGRSAVLCAGDAGLYASSSNRGSNLRLGYLLEGRSSSCSSAARISVHLSASKS